MKARIYLIISILLLTLFLLIAPATKMVFITSSVLFYSSIIIYAIYTMKNPAN